MGSVFRKGTLVGVLAALLISPTTALALPSDTPELYADNFESGLSGWAVTTAGNGAATNPSVSGPVAAKGKGASNTKVAQLRVPDYQSNSIAFMRRTLSEPVYALSAVGWFQVLSGGCDDSAGYSAGNVPFFRFFDTAGRRVAGLYRINGSCAKNGKLYVQHSGSFFRTGANISFGAWNRLELRVTINASASVVEVYLNDRLQYTSSANNGIVPIGSVTIHNEHSNQVGDLLADDVRLATFPTTPPSNPCDASAPAPSNSDPGAVVLADNFESYNFNQWSATGLSGDGMASVETSAAYNSGGCGALIHVSSNTSSRAYLNRALPSATTKVWLDGWFNVKVEGTAGNNVPFWRLFSGTDDRLVDVYRVNGTGQLYLRTPNGSSWTYTSLNRVLALDTWHSIKVHADISAGAVQVWYDGTLVGSRTDVSFGVAAVSSAQIHAEHFTQKGDLAADDVVIKASSE